MIIDWLVPAAFAVSVLVRIDYYGYDRSTESIDTGTRSES